jgi:DNA polymerase III subunit epsilon
LKFLADVKLASIFNASPTVRNSDIYPIINSTTMTLNLQRDLVFFDIEATGLSVVRDRIMQIALIKYPAKGGDPVELSMLINPSVLISEEAYQVHGISPKDVANKPVFGQVAKKIWDFIGNSDLAGYNSNRYDIPMLMEEFARVGMDFDISNRRLIDVQRIFYKMEPRTLKAAYRFYCQKELTDAHDALADVRATVDVFKGQITTYEGKSLLDEDGKMIEEPIKNDMQVLHTFTNDLRFVDATQKIKIEADGSHVFTFGKYAGKPVGETLYKDRQYFHWILEKEFTTQVKQYVKKALKDYEKKIGK